MSESNHPSPSLRMAGWIGEPAYVDPLELSAANARCDAELKSLHFDPSVHVRPAWKQDLLLRKGMLTDKKIAAYEKQGFYSEEFRDLRRRIMAKKAIRSGNFIQRDGRMIYSPS